MEYYSEKFISFEEKIYLDYISFIGALIPETKVLIEQKGMEKTIRQSDGLILSLFYQVKRLITGLPACEHPRRVVTLKRSIFTYRNPMGSRREESNYRNGKSGSTV